MELIIGVGLLCMGALFFCIVLIGTRNPNSSKWFTEFMVGGIYVPLIIVLVVMGTILTILFFSAVKEAAITTGVGLTEDGLAIAMVVGTVILIKAMRIKKRLARFAAISST